MAPMYRQSALIRRIAQEARRRMPLRRTEACRLELEGRHTASTAIRENYPPLDRTPKLKRLATRRRFMQLQQHQRSKLFQSHRRWKNKIAEDNDRWLFRQSFVFSKRTAEVWAPAEGPFLDSPHIGIREP